MILTATNEESIEKDELIQSYDQAQDDVFIESLKTTALNLWQKKRYQIKCHYTMIFNILILLIKLVRTNQMKQMN